MTVPELHRSEYPDFFRRLHGKDRDGNDRVPFRWQMRLLEEIAASGRWPEVLDLPTGAGKTSAIDIALFHLALEATAAANRCAPIRIAFVVDRRIIVDAAHERARRIADRLKAALIGGHSDDVLHRVAVRLAHLSGGKLPVHVSALRGGVPRESDWARTPSQPTVLCSTVDQIGSRLLFRGYGVSDSMRPVHAGLIGSDCLILLDEAHLSEPFRQTLDAIGQYRQMPWVEAQPAPWSTVTMTATPGTSHLRPFSLDPSERNDPHLRPRLQASKPVRLVRSKIRSTEPVAHARELANEAWKLAEIAAPPPQPRAVAVVVNRVALARRIHEELASRIASLGVSADVILLIGRTRDVDRADLVNRYAPLISSEHDPLTKTLFVVATQCIEAGADFDFDALVTQIAPLDALRQRFGRLNRLGRDIPASGVILACPDEISSRADDPLYGKRGKSTWEWLITRASEDIIDFGIDALQTQLREADVSDVTTGKLDAAPILMPAHVELWAQTCPIPDADPEPALFLHGAADAADVQIIWRADIRSADLRGGPPERLQRVIELLTLVPPRAAEAISVPIRAARAWLAGGSVVPISDVEGPAAAEAQESIRGPIPVLRWRGPESSLVRPRELRPGDLLVVPSEVGGCDEYGWLPESGSPVRDIADAAAAPYAASRFAFRVHRELLRDAWLRDPDGHGAATNADGVWRALSRELQEARNETSPTELALRLVEIAGIPEAWKRSLRAIGAVGATTERNLRRRTRSDVRIECPYDEPEAPQISGIVFVARRGIEFEDRQQSTGASDAATESDDIGSFRTTAVELEHHAKDVEQTARQFAHASGLSTDVADDIAVAAFLHDEGKRDARFQLYLRAGDRLALALDQRVLAKSDRSLASSRREGSLRERSGLPERWRHEADSVRRALSHERFAAAHCPLLVLWLIGTHHGFGRPLYPHTDPNHRGPQDLDFLIDGLDWPQIFTVLLKRYGPWELARFEAILRLADHRASEQEDRQENGA